MLKSMKNMYFIENNTHIIDKIHVKGCFLADNRCFLG